MAIQNNSMSFGGAIFTLSLVVVILVLAFLMEFH